MYSIADTGLGRTGVSWETSGAPSNNQVVFGANSSATANEHFLHSKYDILRRKVALLREAFDFFNGDFAFVSVGFEIGRRS
jgi:hypothetical protein